MNKYQTIVPYIIAENIVKDLPIDFKITFNIKNDNEAVDYLCEKLEKTYKRDLAFASAFEKTKKDVRIHTYEILFYWMCSYFRIPIKKAEDVMKEITEDKDSYINRI